MRFKLSVITAIMMVLLVTLAIFGTRSLRLSSSDLSAALPSQLDREGILYWQINPQEFRVIRFNFDQVFSIAKTEAEKMLPLGRSFAPTDEYWRRARPKLEENNISYQIRVVDGERWIIIAPNYKDRWEQVLYGS